MPPRELAPSTRTLAPGNQSTTQHNITKEKVNLLEFGEDFGNVIAVCRTSNLRDSDAGHCYRGPVASSISNAALGASIHDVPTRNSRKSSRFRTNVRSVTRRRREVRPQQPRLSFAPAEGIVACPHDYAL